MQAVRKGLRSGAWDETGRICGPFVTTVIHQVFAECLPVPKTAQGPGGLEVDKTNVGPAHVVIL